MATGAMEVASISTSPGVNGPAAQIRAATVAAFGVTTVPAKHGPTETGFRPPTIACALTEPGDSVLHLRVPDRAECSTTTPNGDDFFGTLVPMIRS